MIDASVKNNFLLLVTIEFKGITFAWNSIVFFFYEIALFSGVVDQCMKWLETIAGRNWGWIGVCKAQ